MQGLEASNQVTKPRSGVGIDASEDWLDIRVPREEGGLRLSNDRRDCQGFRLRAVMVHPMEVPDGSTQSPACSTSRRSRPPASTPK
jgi:hypothetical protein